MPTPFPERENDMYWGDNLFREQINSVIFLFFSFAVVVLFVCRKIDSLLSPHNAAQLRNDKEDWCWWDRTPALAFRKPHPETRRLVIHFGYTSCLSVTGSAPPPPSSPQWRIWFKVFVCCRVWSPLNWVQEGNDTPPMNEIVWCLHAAWGGISLGLTVVLMFDGGNNEDANICIFENEPWVGLNTGHDVFAMLY